MPNTKVRAPMPPSKRAKIFSMFDALHGLKEALAAQEKRPEPRRYLSEDSIAELNQILTGLQKQQMVTVVYYCTYQQETCQRTGPVTRIDPYWHSLQVGEISISFEEIYEVIPIEEFDTQHCV